MKTLDACSFVGYAKVRLQICIGQAAMPIIRWIYYILCADEKEDDTLLLIMQTYDYFFENHIILTIK